MTGQYYSLSTAGVVVGDRLRQEAMMEVVVVWSKVAVVTTPSSVMVRLTTYSSY